MAAPTGGQRVGFWLLFGLTSTAFAEVLFPTTAFDLTTMVTFAVPIYLLHSVVLAAVVYQSEQVRYPTLYLAGVLLGLYESYVTNVVWAPLGDRPFVEIGGLHVFETAGLVLFWHPVVSFLLPVAVVEAVATASNRSIRPPLADHRFVRPLVAAIVVYLLLFQGALGGPLRALFGNVITLLILVVALFFWRRTGGHTHEMHTLLPDGRTLGVLTVVLAAVYLGLTALIRSEELPTRPLPHLPILTIYFVTGGLLTILLRGDEPSAGVSVRVTWRRILAVSGSVVLASPVLGVLGAPFALLIFLSYFAVAVGVGALSLGTVALALRS